LTIKYLLELLLLASLWGASFIFMRIASPEFGPILLIAFRTLTASLLLLPILYITKNQRSFAGNKAKIFIVGMFNTCIPFVLFAYATLTLSGGLTSVLNATTPMFGAMVAYFWFQDKLSPSAALGLLIGFIGVYFLTLDNMATGNNEQEQHSMLLPTLAALVASLCYGISANFTKRFLTGVSAITLATGSQVSASIILIPLSLWYIPTQMPSNIAITSVVILGLLCTGVAYIIFFHLIANLGPNKAISVTYLIPVFGLLWGYIFLNEQTSTNMLLGCGFILVGVALATGLIKFSAIKTQKSQG